MKKAHTFELAIVLFIVILACLLYLAIASRPSQTGGWESSVNSTPDYIFPGSDGRLYAFTGNNVTAIDSNGQVAWKFDAQQDIWKGGRGYGVGVGGSLIRYYQSVPLATEHAGYLYLLAENISAVEEAKKAVINNTTIMDFPLDLIALSPRGEIEWKRAVNETFPASGYLQVVEGPFFPDGPAYFWYPIISGPIMSSDRLYIFHNGQEDIYDANGTLAYKLYGLSSEPVVDERGYVYAMLAAPISEQYILSSIDAGAYYENVIPSGTIAAFKPDGTQAWSLDLGENAAPISVGAGEYSDGLSQLLFANHTLYVPVQNGIAAVSTDGRLLWLRHLAEGPYTPFESMPVDQTGNVYFRQIATDRIYIISPDSQVRPCHWVFNFWSGEAETGSQLPVFLDGQDGIVYGSGSTTYMSPVQFNETYLAGYFDPGHVTAYDLAKNRTLWTFTIPAEDTHALLLTQDNYEEIHSQGLGLDILPDNAGAYTSITQNRIINVYPGRNITYVSYEYTIHEDPIVLNQSRGMYVRELYALDNIGRLLWKEPIGPIRQAVVSNDTLYYSTWGGQMGGGASIAGGIAIIASLYLVLRFVAIGAVSRAKSVLHVNKNRNSLLDYILAHPGSTAMEISKGLPLNMGTLRYHLLILSMNHKIVIHRDGDKYVRYFKNSGTYTQEERALISLVQREPIRKTLKAILKTPGISGTGLSTELGISTTAAYKHLNLLVERGIVAREPRGESGPGYRIGDEYLSYVERMIEQQ